MAVDDNDVEFWRYVARKAKENKEEEERCYVKSVPRSAEDLEQGIALSLFWCPRREILNDFKNLKKLVHYPGGFVPPNEKIMEKFVRSLKVKPRQAEILTGYYKQLMKSMGFEVPILPRFFTAPFELILRQSQYPDVFGDLSSRVQICALEAVSYITKLRGEDHILKNVERANIYPCGYDLYYLTFIAESRSIGPQTFQAVVELVRRSFLRCKEIVYEDFPNLCFIRLKPNPNPEAS